jgi:hypothetical protein
MSNKVKIQPSNIDLVKLKRFRKVGDMEKIAEATGYSRGYISSVLSPKKEHFQPDIIREAAKLIQDQDLVELDEAIATAIIKNGQNNCRNSAH